MTKLPLITLIWAKKFHGKEPMVLPSTVKNLLFDWLKLFPDRNPLTERALSLVKFKERKQKTTLI